MSALLFSRWEVLRYPCIVCQYFYFAFSDDLFFKVTYNRRFAARYVTFNATLIL